MNTVDIEVLTKADHWLQAGLQVNLITVAKTFGSSPRPVGSLMAVCGDGKWVGSISGGCLEQEVMEHLRVNTASYPEILVYRDSDQSGSRQLLLPCGSTLELVIERLLVDSLQPVLGALQRRGRIERCLDIESGSWDDEFSNVGSRLKVALGFQIGRQYIYNSGIVIDMFIGLKAQQVREQYSFMGDTYVRPYSYNTSEYQAGLIELL